jgi:hypothetical protein
MFDYKFKDAKNHAGFIAQDYAEVLPSQVRCALPSKEEEDVCCDGKLWLLDANLNPYLVKAIQEQHAEITDLKAQLASLKAVVDALVAQKDLLVV